jgi:hypothetical protein
VAYGVFVSLGHWAAPIDILAAAESRVLVTLRHWRCSPIIVWIRHFQKTKWWSWCSRR